jgi:hypothetical protein
VGCGRTCEEGCIEELGFDDWPRSVLTLVEICTPARAPGLDAEPFNMEVPPVRGDDDVEFAGGVGIGSEGGLSEDITLV